MDNGYNSKIKKLLKKLESQNFEITEEQLSIFSNNLPVLCLDQSVGEEYFISWFKKFGETWKTPQKDISSKNISLIAIITSVLCTEEQSFVTLRTAGVVDELVHIVRTLPDIPIVPYAQHYYILLLSSFLKHKSGLEWVIETNHWHDIFLITLQKIDKLVFKKACTFVMELLDESKSNHGAFFNKVIDTIISPLISFNTVANSSTNTLLADGVSLNISKRLTILEQIFKEMFTRSCTNRDFSFICIMQERFKIETLLEKLSENKLLQDIYLQINILRSLTIYFILGKYMQDHCIRGDKTAELNHFSAKTYHILQKTFVSNEGYTGLLKLLCENHMCFSQVVKYLIGNETVITEFQYQMLIFLLLPINYVNTLITGKVKQITSTDEDEITEQLTTSFIRKILPLTFKTARAMRQGYTIENALAALNHIQNYSKFYEHNVVIDIVQMIVYSFGKLIEFLQESTNALSDIAQKFLIGILETMIYLCSEFELSLKDGVESILVAEKVGILLKIANLSPKIATRALQLFNVAIRKNLSAQLHLLIDVIFDKELNSSRAIFLPYLICENKDVRKAAVQVIHAMAQTKKDYTSIKRIIIELNIPEKIFNIMTSDPETSVRISATQCLSDILIVDVLWKNLLRIPYFYDKIMKMFYLESDGAIRSEAITLITTIYEHHDLPKKILLKFYDIMSYAVLEDKNNFVKTNALCFWQKVIDRHLVEEGMIDGEFPDVTFSKKLKKIITFDERAIKECLERVLHDLDEIGCLTIFLFAFNSSEDNLDQTVFNLIKSFIDLLKRHYFVFVPDQSPRRDSFKRSFLNPIPNTNSDYSSSSSSIFSPYPESLYEDILDLQESLIPDPIGFQKMLEESDLESPQAGHLNEFVNFVEYFDPSIYNRSKTDDIEMLLDSILS